MRTQVLFLLLAVVALTGMAFADQVIIQENTGGNVITFTGVTPGSLVSVSVPTVAVAGSSSINGTFVPGDSAVGSSISGLAFNYSNTGVFSPAQAIQIGGASSGILSGTVTFVSLTSTRAGAFALNIGLGGLSFATSTATRTAFSPATMCVGVLTFEI